MRIAVNDQGSLQPALPREEHYPSDHLRVAEPFVDLWNEDKLETQLLWGEQIEILDQKNEWLYVEALNQPFYSDHWHGYRGWMRGRVEKGPDAFPEYPIDRKAIIQCALQWLDVPYLLGGLTTHGIDCSAFVHLLYRLAGKIIPRNAAHQYLLATPTDEPQPADLLFKDTDGKIDHVMLYLGDGKIIESAKSAGGVRIAPLRPE